MPGGLVLGKALERVEDHDGTIRLREPGDFLERPSNDFVRSFFQDAQAVTPIGEEAGR